MVASLAFNELIMSIIVLALLFYIDIDSFIILTQIITNVMEIF